MERWEDRADIPVPRQGHQPVQASQATAHSYPGALLRRREVAEVHKAQKHENRAADCAGQCVYDHEHRPIHGGCEATQLQLEHDDMRDKEDVCDLEEKTRCSHVKVWVASQEKGKLCYNDQAVVQHHDGGTVRKTGLHHVKTHGQCKQEVAQADTHIDVQPYDIVVWQEPMCKGVSVGGDGRGKEYDRHDGVAAREEILPPTSFVKLVEAAIGSRNDLAAESWQHEIIGTVEADCNYWGQH
mmetsp:Transcript_52366/g.135717  ORF Transcript_52366/g.135717 Transcript_52366/m.135717 type:complete len:241 (-) Transcript_52366:38-760(-)